MSASTTQKVTKKIIHTLTNIFLNGDGLIVRFKGKEYGAFGFFDGFFTTVEGVTLEASKCTIRKGLPPISPPRSIDQFINELIGDKQPVETVIGGQPGAYGLERIKQTV